MDVSIWEMKKSIYFLLQVFTNVVISTGTWLGVAKECIGYTMVSVTLDAYLRGALFDSIPARSFVKFKAGRDVDMVSRHSGVIRALIGTDAIKAMPSFRSIKWECKVGDFMPKTIDCFTRPGEIWR